MSGREEQERLLMEKAASLKREFEEEIGRIFEGMQLDKEGHKTGMYRGEEEVDSGSLEEYERKLEGLKDELKRLKKIKRRQKKISKLEEERKDVLRDIEKKRIRENRVRRHK
jgi:predicted RNase H-like nuclease (RuvC/YqgF family)